jgi:predicted nucleic acid-binding protein
MTDTEPRRIYFDTNVYIELIEKNSSITPRLARLFGGWEWQHHIVMTGEITVAEVLVKPIATAVATGDYALHDLYLDILSIEPNVTDVLPITKMTWQRAALVRAQLKRFADISIKLPDAVHIAASLEARCDTFVTNDKGLQTAVRAITERRGMSDVNPTPTLKRLVTFADDELDALADELQCP